MKIIQDAIDECIKNGRTKLNLSRKKVGYKGLEFLSLALEKGAIPSLTFLHLGKNQGGDKGVELFSSALEKGAIPSLTKLNLGYNQISYMGLGFLSSALEKGAIPFLTILGLNNNQIGDKGVEFLSSALEKGAIPSLTELYLGNSQIGDKGVELLSSALEKGAIPSLTILALGHNKISDKGNKIIQNTINPILNANKVRLDKAQKKSIESLKQQFNEKQLEEMDDDLKDIVTRVKLADLILAEGNVIASSAILLALVSRLKQYTTNKFEKKDEQKYDGKFDKFAFAAHLLATCKKKLIFFYDELENSNANKWIKDAVLKVKMKAEEEKLAKLKKAEEARIAKIKEKHKKELEELTSRLENKAKNEAAITKKLQNLEQDLQAAKLEKANIEQKLSKAQQKAEKEAKKNTELSESLKATNKNLKKVQSEKSLIEEQYKAKIQKLVKESENTATTKSLEKLADLLFKTDGVGAVKGLFSNMIKSVEVVVKNNEEFEQKVNEKDYKFAKSLIIFCFQRIVELDTKVKLSTELCNKTFDRFIASGDDFKEWLLEISSILNIKALKLQKQKQYDAALEKFNNAMSLIEKFAHKDKDIKYCLVTYLNSKAECEHALGENYMAAESLQKSFEYQGKRLSIPEIKLASEFIRKYPKFKELKDYVSESLKQKPIEVIVKNVGEIGDQLKKAVLSSHELNKRSKQKMEKQIDEITKMMKLLSDENAIRTITKDIKDLMVSGKITRSKLTEIEEQIENILENQEEQKEATQEIKEQGAKNLQIGKAILENYMFLGAKYDNPLLNDNECIEKFGVKIALLLGQRFDECCDIGEA